MSRNTAVHRFEYDGWKVMIKIDGSTRDGVLVGHVDLQCKGENGCRIDLTGKHEDGASAVRSLAEKARGFIDAWDIARLEGAFVLDRAAGAP